MLFSFFWMAPVSPTLPEPWIESARTVARTPAATWLEPWLELSGILIRTLAQTLARNLARIFSEPWLEYWQKAGPEILRLSCPQTQRRAETQTGILITVNRGRDRAKRGRRPQDVQAGSEKGAILVQAWSRSGVNRG